MATNNFKPFALDPNANVTSQADWEALPALLSGFTAGKASSAQVNKAIRQASFIAAALAQYTANKSGLDVLDDGDLNGFISKMGTAFGKDFQALDATLSALAGLATGANKLPYFTGNDTAAQTDLTSVGRDIIGKNTIADILTYLGLVVTHGPTYLTAKIGEFIIIAGNCSGTTSAEGNLNVIFPFAFPNRVFYMNITQANSSYASDTDPLLYSPYAAPGAGPITALGASVRNTKTGASQPNKSVSARYIAVGY